MGSGLPGGTVLSGEDCCRWCGHPVVVEGAAAAAEARFFDGFFAVLRRLIALSAVVVELMLVVAVAPTDCPGALLCPFGPLFWRCTEKERNEQNREKRRQGVSTHAAGQEMHHCAPKEGSTSKRGEAFCVRN